MLIELPNPLAVMTFRMAVVVLMSEPLVPVIVRTKLPVGVLDAVATVSVELAPTLTEAELNEPVALADRTSEAGIGCRIHSVRSAAAGNHRLRTWSRRQGEVAPHSSPCNT